MVRIRKLCSRRFTILFLALVTVLPLIAQSTTPEESLLQAIEERAARDAQFQRPQATASDLQLLFGEPAEEAGVDITRVLTIYEEAYARAKPKKTLWQKLEPKIGWIAASLLFLLLILRDVLKQAITRFFNQLTEAIYRQIAGLRPFWLLSLRRYRRSLARSFRELKIPFRPGRPLQMREVYVPLKISGTSDRQQVDIHSAISLGARLVIVGAPGSGKSMLMKHLTLSYALQGLGPMRRNGAAVPVLLELHRLNDPSQTLEQHLAEALARQNFPSARRFLQAGLERGGLLLLFDGLDEVNQDARDRVVGQIKDLSKRGRGCQIVVTCRAAVYAGELDGWSNKRMEIVEFDDRQIELFLAAWEAEMPTDKSPEHLLSSLQDRPRIMALARNPLLLTIISYLYSDTPFVLPHSRAEFYGQATSVLLEQWDQARQLRNRYKAAHKRLVLQALALAFQERGSTATQDRRSMPLAEVLQQITDVLETLNLTPQDAEPLLDEIVERSGLLLSLDGKTRYQFTHLTLQEFFAALDLSKKPQLLIEKFQADSGAWREVAKLWCGLEHDSTALLEAIAATDRVAALECLGDTQQVETEFSDALIDSFLDNIDQIKDESTTKALALVAADPRPRGEATFARLVSLLSDPLASEESRLAAARIFSMTSLPKAVEPLTQLASSDARFRPFLEGMGNLAIPFLERLIFEEVVWAAELAYRIGTPRAAVALVPLLWSNHESNLLGALYLGSLVSNPKVESALAEVEITGDQRKSEWLDWVWVPFVDDAKVPISVVMGRIAFLISRQPQKDPSKLGEDLVIDQRLALALCCVETGRLVPGQFPPSARKRLEEQFSLDLHSVKLQKKIESSLEIEGFVEESLAKLPEISPMWYFLFHSLPRSCQLELLVRRLRGRFDPGKADWRNILRPLRYAIYNSWHGRVIRLGTWVMTLLTTLAGVNYAREKGALDMGVFFVASGVMILFSFSYFMKRGGIEGMHGPYLFAMGVGGLGSLGEALRDMVPYGSSIGLLSLFLVASLVFGVKFRKRDWYQASVAGLIAVNLGFGIGDFLGVLLGSIGGIASIFILAGSFIENWLVALGMGIACAAFFLPISWAVANWGPLAAGVAWSLAFGCLMALTVRGNLLQQRADNPLTGLLDSILNRAETEAGLV